MLIPRHWEREDAEATKPNGELIPVCAWGFGDDEASARRMARAKLDNIVGRIRRGEPFPERYGYGDRPPREEVLESIDDGQGGAPFAIVTRNSYGARILNTTRLMFLDIDVDAEARPSKRGPAIGGLVGLLIRLFRKPPAAPVDPFEAALAQLREDLEEHGERASFRIYRTRAGFRAIAIDRHFDPTSTRVRRLMEAIGVDSRYAQLCRVQKSFRARLDPKHWRCRPALASPPGRFPRRGQDLNELFANWLANYEAAASAFATCRYVETVGAGTATGEAAMLLKLHDGLSRAHEDLELA